MYKRGKTQHRKVVYDKEKANQIFKECHASAFGAHCGIIKTRDAVTVRLPVTTGNGHKKD